MRRKKKSISTDWITMFSKCEILKKITRGAFSLIEIFIKRGWYLIYLFSPAT